jgi:multicomponent Na+:H+ antiporter subunit D
LLILIPLAALVIANLPFVGGLRKVAFPAALLLSVLQVALVVFVPADLWRGPGALEDFFTFRLAVDNLTLVLLLSIGIVVSVALLAGRCMIGDDRARANFTSVMLIALIGMNGTVLLTDLFSLYVFIEITSVASFILIALYRDRNGLEGAFKYLILSAVATILMIGGVALLLMTAGGTSFATVKAALAASNTGTFAKIAMGAFVCGLFIKGGLVPFHGWLPGAYSSAPAPVSVFLAGIATKVSGIYALIRLVTSVFTPDVSINTVLLLVGAVSIVVGALAALWQTDMKRLLSYSSISQVGYIVLGLGCGTPMALFGAIFHLFNHSIFKSLLFVNSASIEQRVGTTDLGRMGGLGSRMPVTGVTNVIGILSTAGIPPLSGFWSKLIIIVALWQAHYYAYACIAILFSVVTLGYLLLMQRKAFFGETPAQFAEVREATFGLVVGSIVLAAITVGMGVLFPLVINTFILPVDSLF